MNHTGEPAAGERDARVTAILAGIGAITAILAALMLAAPHRFGRGLGYAFAAPSGTVEFVTAYGGFYLGVGVFWLVSAWRTALRAGGAALLAISSTGAAAARGAGAVALGVGDSLTLGLFAGEAAIAALGWAAWFWSLRERRQATRARCA